MIDHLAVPTHFRSVADVVAGLASLDGQLRVSRDRRRLFVMAYGAMTHTIAQWIEQGLFQDGAAMARCAVAFANEYRRALEDSAGGWHSHVRVAWQRSFDACVERQAVFPRLMLGINAYIKRDLPYALIAAGIDVESSACYRDHTLIDDVLKINMPVVRRRIAEEYGAEIPLRERWFGQFATAKIHSRV
jgi:hypothetical protein